MTAAQKAALDEFLTDLVQKAYDLGASKCGAAASAPEATTRRGAATYATGGGHWIHDNSDGKIITLEDGSLWQIDPLDQVDTMLWLPATSITVVRDSHALGDYIYLFVNKDDGERAHAKFLGRE